MPPVESAASRANQLVRKAGDHPSLPFKSTPQCSTLVGTRRVTTIAECALLRRRRGDPTQGKRVVLTMPEVPRSPRGVLVNSPLGTAPIVGPIELLSCLLHLPLFQSVQSEDLNGCVGLNPAGIFLQLPMAFLQRQSFATAEPSVGFLQSVSRPRCGKQDSVSQSGCCHHSCTAV